jgi:metal-responsive CopG/Arc/MetJ family transcriptional regulator
MGRPKLDLVRTTVGLSATMLKRIDAIMGQNRRPKFIREAVEEKLAREEVERPTEPRKDA